MKLKYLFLSLFLPLLVGTNLHAQAQRCGAVEYLEYQKQMDPKIPAKMQEIEKHTNAHLQSAKSIDGVISIPVVFHLVWGTNIPAQNISDAQLLSQLDVLNEDFRRMNADAANTPADFLGVASDIQIEFCLATLDPSGNPTTGITRTETPGNFFSYPSHANDIKSDATGGKDAWPTGDYLNIWVGHISGALGYAPPPGIGAPANDGIVLHYQNTGRFGTAHPPFDRGRTATHEVGHWLNLRHIWGDGDCSVDDLVADTPTQGSPTFAFGSTCNYPGANSCDDGPGDFPDMFQNYMDYSKDVCMNLFTQGQSDRMRVLFEPGGPRASLLNSNGCGTAPSCDMAIDNITPTDESCPGANDGSITVSASCTTCSGIEYSMDGVSFQASNTFNGLNPGAFTATVRDTGDPSCEAADNTTVNGGPTTDSDGDGTEDCNDGCPNDSDKIAPGTCGCGIADVDSDGDGLEDCIDACPNDPDNDIDGDGICGDIDNCPATANAGQADSDCDGVGDACDLCDGGDDTVDNNGDGLPDCAYPPAYADIIDAWKCGNGNNQKVLVCHKNKKTNCISYNALAAHIAHGDYLGPCSHASCSSALATPSAETNQAYLEGTHALEAFPNPFTQQISLKYYLPADGHVKVSILSIHGQEIAKMVDGRQAAGQHQLKWIDNVNLPAGIYFARMQTASGVSMLQLVLTK